jgi:hypothetical protein
MPQMTTTNDSTSETGLIVSLRIRIIEGKTYNDEIVLDERDRPPRSRECVGILAFDRVDVVEEHLSRRKGMVLKASSAQNPIPNGHEGLTMARL